MKLEAELLKASAGLADGRSYKTLTRYDADVLDAFYRSLGIEERRVRFGAAVSDESIARYCEGVDWRSTLVIACGTGRDLCAVATNARIDIRRVENATIANRKGEDSIPTLLRLSAVAARDLFAADRMLVNLDGAREWRHHLKDLGSAALREEYAEVDVSSLGEVARLEGRLARRPRIEAVVPIARVSSC